MFFRKKTVWTILFLIITFITMSTSQVMARNNYAFSAGTTLDNINTVQDINDSSNAYATAGYRTYSMVDPTYAKLAENLYADVQFFSTHGNLDFINFKNCGIQVGNSNSIYIGTNSVNWNNDTILVTYSSCNSAGTGGNSSTDSISCKTAESGANVAVGFRNTIDAGSATNWAKRYNNRLAQGYGVLDSVNYANSYIYLYPNVKQIQVWHHGEANMKIGKYRSMSNNIIDKRNILLKDEMKKKSTIVVENNLESIIAYISQYYPNFDIKNYNIINRNEAIATNIELNEVTEYISYIDFQFKIGDFVTETGYTIEIHNGNIQAIYDNNINIEKQEKILAKTSEFVVKVKETSLEKMRQEAMSKVSKKYNSQLLEDDVDIKYYYDIQADKKYIIYSIPSIIETNNGKQGILYDNVRYEI